ncbi:hypothetical protein SAMN05421847_1874 [Halpernia humi]|uniref:Uncharacterized protein n=1 Tax=Halpernia humi TaxID=493375 RepID=A0A1H5YWT3_9FLAO|nr:hypothetical protein [Halpernia humi]SEG27907.1 hypothetical protein SAMN05421847_1874 [Halpernia humi]
MKNFLHRYFSSFSWYPNFNVFYTKVFLLFLGFFISCNSLVFAQNSVNQFTSVGSEKIVLIGDAQILSSKSDKIVLVGDAQILTSKGDKLEQETVSKLVDVSQKADSHKKLIDKKNLVRNKKVQIKNEAERKSATIAYDFSHFFKNQNSDADKFISESTRSLVSTTFKDFVFVFANNLRLQLSPSECNSLLIITTSLLYKNVVFPQFSGRGPPYLLA